MQSELELPHRSVILLLTLADEPEIKMGFGRVRVELECVVERGNGTFEVTLLGKPDTDRVVDACRGRARGRVGGRGRRFAGRRELRWRSRGDQQQKNAAAADERPT